MPAFNQIDRQQETDDYSLTPAADQGIYSEEVY